MKDAQDGNFYPDKDGFLMLEMPYKGGDITMLILLPMDPDGLALLESRLVPEALARWAGAQAPRAVHVTMPLFKVAISYRVEKALAGMGMPSAFQRPTEQGGADFSAMTDSDDRNDSLFISAAIHRAFIEVNEKGTEAAAATAVIMAAFGEIDMDDTVPFVPRFRADHPFLYMIRDRRSGAMLFAGRMMKPVGE